MHSSDGITWTSANAPEDNKWQSITFGNGKFVAVAGSGKVIVMMYSPTDGEVPGLLGSSSTRRSITGVKSLVRGTDKFVAVASSVEQDNRVMYSTDGLITGLEQRCTVILILGNLITYGNGKFVAVSDTGTNRVMYRST